MEPACSKAIASGMGQLQALGDEYDQDLHARREQEEAENENHVTVLHSMRWWTPSAGMRSNVNQGQKVQYDTQASLETESIEEAEKDYVKAITDMRRRSKDGTGKEHVCCYHRLSSTA